VLIYQSAKKQQKRCSAAESVLPNAVICSTTNKSKQNDLTNSHDILPKNYPAAYYKNASMLPCLFS